LKRQLAVANGRAESVGHELAAFVELHSQLQDRVTEAAKRVGVDMDAPGVGIMGLPQLKGCE
jgi:hypothetical protein